MECPKCYGEMTNVLQEGAVVDRCGNCHGLYFDQLTQALLPDLMSQDAIDSGSDEMGAAYDEMVYVECPKCDKIMDQRLIEEPVRIRFELCPTCHSTFLDAGELREYLSPEFLDHFTALLPEA